VNVGLKTGTSDVDTAVDEKLLDSKEGIIQLVHVPLYL